MCLFLKSGVVSLEISFLPFSLFSLPRIPISQSLCLLDYLITYYSLLFPVSLPPYPLFWKISLKFLLFSFKILIILISKVLPCFVMIPSGFFWIACTFIEILKPNAIYWGSTLERSLHSRSFL